MCGSDMNSSVILDDTCVHDVWEGSEELHAVFGIFSQFRRMVGKHEGGSFNCDIPSNEPLAMCVDNFVRLGGAEDELNVTHMFGAAFIMGDSVLSCKDAVEVNSSSQQEVSPLGVWKLREAW